MYIQKRLRRFARRTNNQETSSNKRARLGYLAIYQIDE
jgi:hypothetical protein